MDLVLREVERPARRLDEPRPVVLPGTELRRGVEGVHRGLHAITVGRDELGSGPRRALPPPCRPPRSRWAPRGRRDALGFEHRGLREGRQLPLDLVQSVGASPSRQLRQQVEMQRPVGSSTSHQGAVRQEPERFRQRRAAAPAPSPRRARRRALRVLLPRLRAARCAPSRSLRAPSLASAARTVASSGSGREASANPTIARRSSSSNALMGHSSPVHPCAESTRHRSTLARVVPDVTVRNEPRLTGWQRPARLPSASMAVAREDALVRGLLTGIAAFRWLAWAWMAIVLARRPATSSKADGRGSPWLLVAAALGRHGRRPGSSPAPIPTGC